MWRNDPDQGAVPKIGEGTVDVGRRTELGEAVIYNGEVDELVAFIGDDQLVAVEGAVYRKTAEGTLAPLAAIDTPTILIKPPAGDWYTVTEDQFKQEFAIHVEVKPKIHNATTSGEPPHEPVKKAPAKKAAPRKAAAKKAVARKR